MSLILETPTGATRIVVEAGCLARCGARLAEVDASAGRAARRCVVMTDETVGALYGAVVTQSLRGSGLEVHELRVAPGEKSKGLDTLREVYAFLAQHRLGRDGLILALGGGVVSDLAGLAAATWMRGVRFAICPTTLEAQIDAAIGGKTAINVPGGKNLVGAFHQPVLVLVDPTCLRTLGGRDVRAGLAESVKHALISSEAFLAWHERNVEAILALEECVLSELIERNVQIKAGIVERDPYERTGARMMLNLGHTMGHAIEECCGYALRHGECVALGMLAACRLSQSTGLLDQAVVERVQVLLKRFGLPTRIEQPIPSDRIMDTITRDKKARGMKVQWVLLEAIGKTRVTSDVGDIQVRSAFGSLCA